jgi:hypothetical protein
MPSTKEIVEQAESLPVEDLVLVVDSLPRTLNPPDAEVDRKWAEVANRRLAELRSGRVAPLPGDVEPQIREAIEFHLDDMREDGIAIPQPASRVEYVEIAA